MNDKLQIKASCLFNDKELHSYKILIKLDAENVIPPNHSIDTSNYSYMKSQSQIERRKRFVDMVAAEFAHMLTEALYKINKKEY